MAETIELFQSGNLEVLEYQQQLSHIELLENLMKFNAATLQLSYYNIL